MTKNLALGVLAVGLALSGYFLYQEKSHAPIINSGNPDQTLNEKSDLIRVESPLPNSKIDGAFTLKGEARGYWYFEASFPVEIVDDSGILIWQGPAQAKGDWMTKDFVPFELEIPFVKPETGTSGKIILHKDNPSGLPENDAFIEIPITF